MNSRTVTIYGQDFSMYLFLPGYVIDCDMKQLKKVTKILVYESFSDWHTIESQLTDMIEAAKYGLQIARKKSDRAKMQKKLDYLTAELQKVEA